MGLSPGTMMIGFHHLAQARFGKALQPPSIVGFKKSDTRLLLTPGEGDSGGEANQRITLAALA